MNAPTMSLVSGVLVLLAVPFATQAAEPSHRCAQQNNDAQRLACYDAEFGKPGAASRSATPAPVLPAAAIAAPVPSTAPVATVVRPAAVAAAAPVLKSENSDAGKGSAAARPSSVASSITSLRRMSDGRHQATLDNGEVWAQVEADPRVEMAVGDSVTIRPAALGSFMLVTESGLPTRVKRVK